MERAAPGSKDVGAEGSEGKVLKIQPHTSGGGEEIRTEAGKKLEVDRTLFMHLLLDLKLAKATESVKVRGIMMCLLGEIYAQYAGVIGEWKSKKLGNFQETFFGYLNDRLQMDVAKESDELVSGYLEAVCGLLKEYPQQAARCVCACVRVCMMCVYLCARSACVRGVSRFRCLCAQSFGILTLYTKNTRKNCSPKDFLTTVYSKLCSILQNSALIQRYKVVIAALEVVKERAALFQERLLLESPDKIYAALLILCAHSNPEVKYPAMVSFSFSISLSLWLLLQLMLCPHLNKDVQNIVRIIVGDVTRATGVHPHTHIDLHSNERESERGKGGRNGGR